MWRSWPRKSSALWKSTWGKGRVPFSQRNGVLPVLWGQTMKQSSLREHEWGVTTWGVIERTSVTMPSPKPGRPISRHWWPQPYWQVRSKGWADQLVGRGWLAASTPTVVTIPGGGPGDAWGGTQRPQQVGIHLESHQWCLAMGTIREDVSGLPAPPNWEDGSLSKRTKLWLQKTLLQSGQSRHEVEGSQWSVTWGPCLPLSQS